MGEFRTELRERLANVAERSKTETKEYERRRDALDQAHAKTMSELGRERAALEQLLTIEDQRTGMPALGIVQKLQILVPLADFLIAKVKTGCSMSKDELRATANLAGYRVDGRTFHATLLNTIKSGRLVKAGNRYAAPGLGSASLFHDNDEVPMTPM